VPGKESDEFGVAGWLFLDCNQSFCHLKKPRRFKKDRITGFTGRTGFNFHLVGNRLVAGFSSGFLNLI